MDNQLNSTAAAFIGASVTLVLVIIFMVLMVVLVRQCLAFMSKRATIRAQVEQQRRARERFERQRGSITEPVPATFDWHHSIRIAGTPPPTYREAQKLPSFEDGIVTETRKKKNSERIEEWNQNGVVEENHVDGSHPPESLVNEAAQSSNENAEGVSRNNESESVHVREVEVSLVMEEPGDTQVDSHDAVDSQVDSHDVVDSQVSSHNNDVQLEMNES